MLQHIYICTTTFAVYTQLGLVRSTLLAAEKAAELCQYYPIRSPLEVVLHKRATIGALWLYVVFVGFYI